MRTQTLSVIVVQRIIYKPGDRSDAAAVISALARIEVNASPQFRESTSPGHRDTNLTLNLTLTLTFVSGGSLWENYCLRVCPDTAGDPDISSLTYSPDISPPPRQSPLDNSPPFYMA